MDLDDVMTLAVAAGASVSLIALLCRLDALRYRSHMLSIVLMHVFLGATCVLALMHALAGQVDIIDAAAVASALCWIKASYRNWRDGVPQIYSTAPAELDEAVPTTRPHG